MELQTALVCLGIAVVTAAVLLLVSLFGSSRTSYEEARAEQRRAATELLALAGGGATGKLKKSKKQGKKAKEKKHKEVAQTGSERDSDGPADSGAEEELASGPASTTPPPAQRSHVEFGDSTVLEVQADKPVKIQIRKRGKDPKIKPILLNKEDVSCVSEPGTPPTPSEPAVINHFEEIHPKDEFELLHATLPPQKAEKKEEVVEKKEGKAKGGKGKHGKQAAPPAPAAPAAAPAPADEPARKERHSSGDSGKEQRKTKKNDKRHSVDEAGDKEVAPPPLNPVQPADLTTDKLLRAAPLAAPPAPAPTPAPVAAPAVGKSKKGKKSEPSVLTLVGGDGGGVNVSELVRLVSEAALSRNEIQILTDALLNKQHGPLPQHSEWSEGPNDPVQKLKKQLAEKEKALADEQEASQAVHAKLKELRASLNVERSRASAAVRAAEEAVVGNKVEVHTLNARMQRLLEENQALAQDKLLLQSKLSAEGEAQAQRVQLELRIQRQNETEAALLQQLGALQAEAGSRALEAQQADCVAVAARDAAHLAQQHAAELAQQLQEATRACAELEAARARAVHAEAAAGGARDELQAELQRLRGAEHALLQAERAREEADRQNRQLSSEIKSLREQLVAKEEEMKKEHQNHQQNGLPPPEDSQKKVELLKLEAVLEGLRSELTAAQAAHDDERRQLHALQQQLEQYKVKNNELRTKNWKVMEALQAAERALQSKVPGAPAPATTDEAVARALEQQQRETAEVLRAACPQAAPAPDAALGAPWLAAYAAQLRTVLRAAAPPPAPAPTPPAAADDALRGQNAHLQELLDKYKKVIDDTEGTLSQLQQNVTTAEQRWARQLSDKQRELDLLQQTTVTQEPLAFAFSCIEKSLPAIVSEMQNKIDALQAELARSRRDRPLDLAGTERDLEEHTRLLISEKHQIESLNGPSQVGLEEK